HSERDAAGRARSEHSARDGVPKSRLAIERQAPPLHQLVDVELENPRGVLAQNLHTSLFLQLAHLALDRLRRMRPRSLVMRIVIGPQEIVHEVVTLGELEADRIILK